MQKSTFTEVAQEIATIQHYRFAQQAQDLENEINAATRTIAECPYEDEDAQRYIVGTLRGMLAGMAGLSATNDGLILHKSCFDSKVTEAMRGLVAAINDRV